MPNEYETGFSGDRRTCTGLHSMFLNNQTYFQAALRPIQLTLSTQSTQSTLNQLPQSCYYFTAIDECSEGSHTCDKNANCTNIDGSFECQCKIGFSGDGHTCTGIHSYNVSNK